MNKFRNGCCLLVLLLFCCRKPYAPSVIAAPNSYLVVEGVINSGGDSTTIKLSKTVNLNAQITQNPLNGATVLVESDQNGTWPLVGDGRGNYTSPGLSLPPGPNYRIHITTPDGKQYISDYQPIKPTPPIDSIGYTVLNNGIQLYVNAHDPANNTHYYRWEYNEAWIFHAKYESQFMLDSATATIVPRPANKQVYYCYNSGPSSHILLTSTTRLSHDVVYQNPLTNIPFTSEKLEINYEMVLRQYAVTSGAYKFYQNIQKNTEQLGSIFDAQPTQLEGNIHNTANANETVIGYMAVTNIQTKRFSVTSAVVPKTVKTIYPDSCEEDYAAYRNKQGYNDVLNILIDPPLTDLPTSGVFSPSGMIVGYFYSTPICTDCALRGNLGPPWFWK